MNHLETAAQQLRQAHEQGRACPPVRSLLPAGDLTAAYQVQDINTRHWLEQGRRLTGRKIGLTSLAVQRQLGVDQPDFGMLFADMAVADGEEIAPSRLLQPRIEAEVALVLDHDLDCEQPTMTDLLGCIGYALPAFEIVGSRIQNWDISIVDTIADNASSGLYVLGGTPRKLAGLDLQLCGMVIERRGEPVATGAGQACLGHPLTAALWLARKMVAVGMPLRAGDTLLSGALGPMVPVTPGDVFEARINGLGAVTAVFGAEE
ncbi:2-keto-4-pentenoate hydratase [Oceanisphaera sp. KMM 10153]|uniref:2-keto-4-pentenoate hydratase n=1 Tax=Oceanisphaera submarina TaxID=3390193 RepID=UPI0039756232